MSTYLTVQFPRSTTKHHGVPCAKTLPEARSTDQVARVEDLQLALSGAMVIARALWVLNRLEVPPSAWPRLGEPWLQRLQRRYGIRWRRSFGEDGLVGLAAVEEEFQKLRSLIRSYSYDDVYNMDGTSFFNNNVPRGSLCINEAPSLKQDKSRLTLAVCINVTGTDKMPLLFIGKSTRPRWIAKKPDDTLYTATNKTWMTTDTFQAWLRDVDSSMRAQQRHILILVDNASLHCHDGVTLTNVCVARLPANTTFKLQPLDQGIIYCIKRDVLQNKMEFAMDAVDEGVKNSTKLAHSRRLSGAPKHGVSSQPKPSKTVGCTRLWSRRRT
ncbi:unnamed protein product [Phytophthora fragariaefolia]|uniref:Unnamed protein product n=1 Tax=Phytophthora fragariaefolia TaxID=1490495 RepID=A0A9W7CPJ5_9STRA|nr:unnamed protein product [Phytophthora fragariaefolia]